MLKINTGNSALPSQAYITKIYIYFPVFNVSIVLIKFYGEHKNLLDPRLLNGCVFLHMYNFILYAYFMNVPLEALQCR